MGRSPSRAWRSAAKRGRSSASESPPSFSSSASASTKQTMASPTTPARGTAQKLSCGAWLDAEAARRRCKDAASHNSLPQGVTEDNCADEYLKGHFHFRGEVKELIGTALLVVVGLSLVILMFGTGSPIARIVPDEGVRRLITGFLFGTTGALIALGEPARALPALERLKITDETPNPPGGMIERDARRVPTGILRENAMALVSGNIGFEPNQITEQELLVKVARLTERNRVERRYREIVEQAADIIYTRDMDGCLRTINEAVKNGRRA